MELPYRYLFVKKDNTVIYKDTTTRKKRTEDVLEEVTPYFALNVPCIFEEGYTINDLFELVSKHETLKHLATGFDVFNKERLSNPENANKQDGKIVFNWTRLEKEYYFKTGSTTMDITLRRGNASYSVSFSPVYNLAHLEIEVDPAVREQDLKGNILHEEIDHPALIHIINGFFWEISFHGYPEERDKELDSLLTTVENIKNGKEKLTPFDSVKELFDDIKNGVDKDD